MVKKVLLINGPNLNLLGTREPEKYGTTTLKDIEMEAHQQVAKHQDAELFTYQNNTEGFIIDRIQEAKQQGVGFIIINAGAYTHTSVGIRDPFRHHLYLLDKAIAVIAGLGVYGYTAAIEYALNY